MTSEPTPPSVSWRRDLVWLLLIAGAAYFFLLGRAPLSNPDEGRYAEISREMVATGDWVTPRLDGIHYFEKPPLMYWAVALAQELVGPGEGALRAVVALFAIAGIAITYIAGRSLYGRGAGIWSAVALGTSLLYFALGHILLLDMAVSVLMSAALFFFLLGIGRDGPAARCHPERSEGSTWIPSQRQTGFFASLRMTVRTSSGRGQVEKLDLGSGDQVFQPDPFHLTFAEPTPSRRPCLYGFYICAALATLTKGLIGFLIPGAVIFLWLLVFNQWRRLRPLYLPTGLLLFLAIAAPWHLIMAHRNPAWAHFYFIHEHFQRFATSEARRVQPWWFYVPIVLLGLFPWTGFLWPALRDSLAGGWARRKENADAWFLVTWAAFIFLLFTYSQSKLIPYILPVFPPLAVLIGAQLARPGRDGRATHGHPERSEGSTWIPSPGQTGSFASPRMTERTGGPPVPSSPRSSLTPYLVFACISWLLAAALLVAALKPGVIRDPGQAAALKPWALGLAMMLAVWSAITLVVAKRSKALDQQGRDGPPARPGTTEVVAQERASRPPVLAKAGVNVSPLACVLATTSILFGVLVIVRPAIDIRGTKPLALEFAALAQPGDKVYHYHGFFHDFTYYSGRTVGLVDYRDELEPENDDPAAMARILISDADFRAQWAGSGRVFAVARKQAAKELFADPAFHYRLLGEDPGHYLFSNR